MDKTIIKRYAIFAGVLLGVFVIVVFAASLVRRGIQSFERGDAPVAEGEPLSSVDVSKPKVLGAGDVSEIQQLGQPITAFLRTPRRELWVSSNDGKSMIGLGVSYVADVFNGPNRRWLIYQGNGNLLKGERNILYAYDLRTGTIQEIVHPNPSEGIVVSVTGPVTISPDEHFIAYRADFFTMERGVISGVYESYPNAAPGIYVYDMYTQTRRYMGNAPAPALWESNSESVIVSDGEDYHGYNLAAGDYSVDVTAGTITDVTSSAIVAELREREMPEVPEDESMLYVFLRWLDYHFYIALGVNTTSPLGGDLYVIDSYTGGVKQTTNVGDVVLF